MTSNDGVGCRRADASIFWSGPAHVVGWCRAVGDGVAQHGTFPTKAEARIAYTNDLVKHEGGSLLEPSKSTVDELRQGWLTEQARTVTANTTADDRLTMRNRAAEAALIGRSMSFAGARRSNVW